MAWLYLIPVLALTFAASFGYSFVSNFQGQAAKIEQLSHQIELDNGKLNSYRRMIDRRDAAIKASKCKNQIENWVRNPDDVPKPPCIPSQLGKSCD